MNRREPPLELGAKVRESVVQALEDALAGHEIKARVEAPVASPEVSVRLEMPAGAQLAGQLISALPSSATFEPRLSAAGEKLVRTFHDTHFGGSVSWQKDEAGKPQGLVIRLDARQAEALARRLEELRRPKGPMTRWLERWRGWLGGCS